MNKRKALVVKEALALFVEKGIHKTSIQDIIDRAGISKGTFYNYFSSKHECVWAMLEKARYDARLKRTEIIIGHDSKSFDVLADQISVLFSMNRKSGLDNVVLEILHSGDKELQQLVMKYRIFELEWLSERFKEVFDFRNKYQSFEASVIFFGMMQHIAFSQKVVQQHSRPTEKVVELMLHYMASIVETMNRQPLGLLDERHVALFLKNWAEPELEKPEILEELRDLQQQSNLTMSQKQIVDAVAEELTRTETRAIVVEALLQTLMHEFSEGEVADDAKRVSNGIWYLIRKG